jgi:hypothetical protein
LFFFFFWFCFWVTYEKNKLSLKFQILNLTIGNPSLTFLCSVKAQGPGCSKTNHPWGSYLYEKKN